MDEINIDRISSYDNYGAQQSASAGGDSLVLKAHFEMLYQNELKRAIGISERRKQKIDELEVKNTGLSTHNKSLKQNVTDKNTVIETEKVNIRAAKDNEEKLLKTNQTEIDKREIELEALKSGKKVDGVIIGLGDKLQYYITTFIEIGFTAYLWLFYTSVIYGAFMMSATKSVIDNLKAKSLFSLTVFNPNALTDSWKVYGFIGLAFLTIAPFFIFALGLLINKFQHKKQYLKAGGVYLVTLFLDSLMSFAIVRNIHNANYSAGATPNPWEWKFALQETDFYIIIIAGFAAYIVWGFILTYIIDEYDNIVPSRVSIKTKEVEIQQFKANEQAVRNNTTEKIAEITAIIKKIEMEIEELCKQIQNNATAIATNEMEISNLKKTEKDVDLEALRSKISQFFIGWCNQIKLTMETQKDSLIPRCNDEQQHFFDKLNAIHQI